MEPLMGARGAMAVANGRVVIIVLGYSSGQVQIRDLVTGAPFAEKDIVQKLMDSSGGL
jgi:hypothetical protein